MVVDVFEEAPLPPLPEISHLEDDLAISSSDEEGAPPVSGMCSSVAAVSPHPAEPSFPDLLDHPLPPAEGDLSMPSLDALAAAPSTAASFSCVFRRSSCPVPKQRDHSIHTLQTFRLPSHDLQRRGGGGGEISGSFILDGEHFGTVCFVDDRLCSFRIPSKPLIRYMAHILHRCSLSPFSMESKELMPFEHCVLLKQAFNAAGSGGYKLAVTQDKVRSSEDFHSKPLVQKAAEKVLNSFKGVFSRLPPSPKSKEEPRVAFQATGKLADYLNAPLLDISRMHKEDNIQAIVSTNRPSLVLEEKEDRDQLKRAVDIHESFIQTAKFLSTLQEGSYPQDRGSLSMTLKNYA